MSVANRVLRAASIAFGVMFVAAAVSKMLQPLEPYEFSARLVGFGAPAAAVLAATAAVEAALGVAMIAGVVRGFVPTFVLLAVATAGLVHVKANFGGLAPCGCFTVFLPSSVEDSIVRNAVLLPIAALCAAAALIVNRRAPGASAASGPSTRSP